MALELWLLCWDHMEIKFFLCNVGKPTKSIPGDAKSGSNQLANSAAAFTEKYKAEGKAKQTGKRKGGDAKPVPKRAKESKTS